MVQELMGTIPGSTRYRKAMTYRDTIFIAAVTMVAAGLLLACAPTVKVQAPDKPIEINMNVKIEHEIRVKVEKDIDDLLSENKDLF